MPSFRPTPLALALGLLAGAVHAQEPAVPATPAPGPVLDAIDADSREAPTLAPVLAPAPVPVDAGGFVPGQETSVEAVAATAPTAVAPAEDPVVTTTTTVTTPAADAVAPGPTPVATTTTTTTTVAAPADVPPVLAPGPVAADASVPVQLAPDPTPLASVPAGPLSYEPGYVAPNPNPPAYLGVTYSHLFPTDRRAVGSGPGFGVFAGIPLTPRVALEGGISGFQLPAKSGDDNADLRPLFGQLGLAFSVLARQSVDVLLLGSGGYGRTSGDDDRSLRYGDVGVGFNGRTPFTNLSVRADVRYARLFGAAEQNTVRANAGVLFAFGTAPPVETLPRDADGDGVLDARDRCPATLAGTLVDGFGCPVPPVVDADGDGIPDAWDLCPGTPANAITDKRGCEAARAAAPPANPEPVVAPPPPPLLVTPLPPAVDAAPALPGTGAAETRVETVVTRPPTETDPDGDGVDSPADTCPDTLPGLLVDAAGCAVRQTLVLPAVAFEGNGARLSPDAGPTLDALARLLLGQPALKLEVGGYTDSLGPQAANLSLSEKRATAVRDALLARRLDAGRIRAEGFGEFVPIGDNATAAGRAQNRRIEFTFVP